MILAAVKAAALAALAAGGSDDRRAAEPVRIEWLGATEPVHLAADARAALGGLPDLFRERVEHAERRFAGALAGTRLTLEVRHDALGGRGHRAGVTTTYAEEGAWHRIVVFPESLARGEESLARTLDHELVHAVHRQRVGPAVETFPRWLREGLAVALSGTGELVSARAGAALGLRLDPRHDAAPRTPPDVEVDGYLRLLAAAEGKDAEERNRLWDEVLGSARPLDVLAAALALPKGTKAEDVERELADRAAEAWSTQCLAGWSELAFVRDRVRGAPLDAAADELEAFCEAHPRSFYRAELELAFAERAPPESPAARARIDSLAIRADALPPALWLRFTALRARPR